MNQQHRSIFKEYFSPVEFSDRYARDPAGAVDVIIPIIHANELWRANLHSLYREIPIHRLLIGDGGCKGDSIEVVRNFPRVEIHDHRAYVSLGYSIRKLIEAVSTEWFIYVHSDVYVPPGWFDAMRKHQGEFDWFGCPQRVTVLAEYPLVDHFRPYAGSQMGRKAAFEKGLSRIDDDYVYRQEDFVFADIVTKAGYKEGRIEDTFHYHQLAYRSGPWSRKIKRVSIEVEQSLEEEIRAALTQARGIVKYLDPDPVLATWVRAEVNRMADLRKMSWDEFNDWVAAANPAWLPQFRWDGVKYRLRDTIIGALWRAMRRR